MKKIIYRFILTISLIIFLTLIYLSLIGIETTKFNNQLINKVKNINQNLEIELKKIKLVLDPFNLSIKAKTLGTNFKLKENKIETETITSKISIKSIINNEFSIKDLYISTKPLDIKKLVSFVRRINNSTELLILENFIKKGVLIADLRLEFDEKGNIKNNYNIKGLVRDTKINFLKKHKLEKVNFIFDVNQKKINFENINFFYNQVNFELNKVFIKEDKKNFIVNGEFENKNFKLTEENLNNFYNFQDFKIKEINFNSKNDFSFNIDRKLKFKNFKLNTEAKINKLIIKNNFDFGNIFPDLKKEIKFTDHNLKINLDKNKLNISGDGNVLIQDTNDIIRYKISKKDKIFKFENLLEIKNDIIEIDFLNFKSKVNKNTLINLNGSIEEDNKIKIENLILKNDLNKILIDKVLLSNELEIISLNKGEFNYFDKENLNNNFQINKKNRKYFLNGDFFNANNFIKNLLKIENKDKSLPFRNDFDLNVYIKKVQLDKEYALNDLKGDLTFKDKNFKEAELIGFFENKGKMKLTISSFNNEKTTTFYSDQAKPFLKRYKFIKGFEGGSLDYSSNVLNKKTTATLKVYDFRLNELPVLTKLLTLASLQGIADLLKGEGIGFNEFEMNFNEEGSLMTIDEIYAIGPAISILMNGYVEKNNLISLRGTLVPATTLNKVIGSIPFLGNILVGTKTGEGVFGVSFKIKGPPKKLETSVNPIKTLTPRFITRTLEKIKKTN